MLSMVLASKRIPDNNKLKIKLCLYHFVVGRILRATQAVSLLVENGNKIYAEHFNNSSVY